MTPFSNVLELPVLGRVPVALTLPLETFQTRCDDVELSASFVAVFGKLVPHCSSDTTGIGCEEIATGKSSRTLVSFARYRKPPFQA